MEFTDMSTVAGIAYTNGKINKLNHYKGSAMLYNQIHVMFYCKLGVPTLGTILLKSEHLTSSVLGDLVIRWIKSSRTGANNPDGEIVLPIKDMMCNELFKLRTQKTFNYFV